MNKTIIITLSIDTEMSNKEIQDAIYQSIKEIGIDIDFYKCQIK